MNQHCFQVGHAADATLGTLAEMLAANADDQALCEWLTSAKPGDEFLDGEGVVCLDDPVEVA